MKRVFEKSIVLIFSIMLILLLATCQNPFLVDATKLYKVTFETNCDTKIDSYRTAKIESIKELTKADYEFNGWYTNAAFDGEPVAFPYELTEDTTFYAKWVSKYCTVIYYDNKTMLRTDAKIIRGTRLTKDQLPELTKPDGKEFDGWYTSKDFDGTSVSFPYEVKTDTIFYARWLKTLTFYSTEISSSYNYNNGVLTLDSDYDKFIFKGESSAVFSNLCIKPTSANQVLLFDNFSFSSSKATPLIESAFDISIEYKGTNKLSSTSSSAVSLIKSIGIIEINGDGNSSLELHPNATTTADCAIIRASRVIINGGNFIIKGSNGRDGNSYEINGVNGSTGIRADVEIKNNAVVTISGGNGGKGAQGSSGEPGEQGSKSAWIYTNGGQGEDGKSGKIGGAGGNGGYAIYGKVKVESAKITLYGGKGGAGGVGGTGGNGGTGGSCTAWYSTGGTGGRGGNGGSGGAGGNGGNAVYGNVEVESAEIVLSGGNGGKGGNCCNGFDTHVGSGGKAGNGGKGGTRGNGGNAGIVDKQQDTTVNLTAGESGSVGDVGKSGNDGFIGDIV